MGKKNNYSASTTAGGGKASKRSRGSASGTKGRHGHTQYLSASDEKRPDSAVDKYDAEEPDESESELITGWFFPSAINLEIFLY